METGSTHVRILRHSDGNGYNSNVRRCTHCGWVIIALSAVQRFGHYELVTGECWVFRFQTRVDVQKIVVLASSPITNAEWNLVLELSALDPAGHQGVRDNFVR